MGHVERQELWPEGPTYFIFLLVHLWVFALGKSAHVVGLRALLVDQRFSF